MCLTHLVWNGRARVHQGLGATFLPLLLLVVRPEEDRPPCAALSHNVSVTVASNTPYFCLGMHRGRISGATKPGQHCSYAVPEAGVAHPKTQGTAQALCAASSSTPPRWVHFPDKELRHQDGKGPGRVPSSPGARFLICGQRANGRHHRAHRTALLTGSMRRVGIWSQFALC